MEGKKLTNIKIEHCLHLIEKKVNLGDAKFWKQRDFETVSGLIEDDTGILLSASTIKRLFQNKQGSVPQTATLIALAQFAGYPSFQAVPADQTEKPEHDIPKKTGSQQNADSAHASTKASKAQTNKRKFSVPAILIAAITLSVLLIFVIKAILPAPKNSFTGYFSHKISNNGVPSTVLFNFDVPRTESDSLWLQPTYDSTKRIFLPYDIKQYHHVYYHPSYHRAKLILNGNEIAETGVHIKTLGWMGVIYKGSEIQRPYYLPPFDADSGKQVLYVAKSDSEGQKLLNTEELYRIRYYNIADFNDISGDSLIASFETYLERSPASPCVKGFISLLCHNGRFFISLDEAGCAGESRVAIGSQNILGKYTDLTALGLIQNQWQPIKIATANEKVKISVGERNIVFDYHEKMGALKGIVFEFLGKGKVKNFKIESLR